MEAIKTEALAKRYGAAEALTDASFCVREGELFGLLGVNGAGKTTLIRILSGLCKPTAGEAYVFGKNIKTELPRIKEIIAVSPQETSVAGRLTVKENLNFFASIFYGDKARREARTEEIVETFGLQEVLGRRARTLSGGWQRRVSIAAALVSEPKILFLDEPTLGLDVLARRELWSTIERLKGSVTILLTSHYLEEIEALCDRIAILNRGKIVRTGTAKQIKFETGSDNLEDAFVRSVKGEAK